MNNNYKTCQNCHFHSTLNSTHDFCMKRNTRIPLDKNNELGLGCWEPPHTKASFPAHVTDRKNGECNVYLDEDEFYQKKIEKTIDKMEELLDSFQACDYTYIIKNCCNCCFAPSTRSINQCTNTDCAFFEIRPTAIHLLSNKGGVLRIRKANKQTIYLQPKACVNS